MSPLDFSAFEPVETPKDGEGVPAAQPSKLDFSGFEPVDQIGRMGTAGAQFVRGATSVVAGLPKAQSIAQAGGNLAMLEAFDRMDRGEDAPLFGDVPAIGFTDIQLYRTASPEERARIRETYHGTDPRAMAGYKLGDTVSKTVDETLPVNPEYAEEFLTSKVPKGLGSAAGFLATGVLGRAAGAGMLAPAAGAGAALEATGQFEEALSHKSSIEDAFRASKLGAVIGTSEAIPITRLLDRLDKGSGGSIKRLLREAIKQGTEEAAQEVFQTIAGNLIASDIVAYDPDRETFKGSGEAGAVGFTVGALMQTIGGMILPGRQRGRTMDTPEMAAPAPEPSQDAQVPPSGTPSPPTRRSAPAPQETAPVAPGQELDTTLDFSAFEPVSPEATPAAENVSRETIPETPAVPGSSPVEPGVGQAVQSPSPPAAPAKKEPERSQWREIGVNENGDKVFEDQRGVRSVLSGRIRSTEPVQTAPDGTISVNPNRRDSVFDPVDEIKEAEKDVSGQWPVHSISEIQDPEEARAKGGKFSAVANRASPWAAEKGYGDTPQAAAADARRRLDAKVEKEKARQAVRDSREIAAGRLPVEDDRERQRRENVAKMEAQEKTDFFKDRDEFVGYLSKNLPEGYQVARYGEGTPVEIYGPQGDRERQFAGLPQRENVDRMIASFRARESKPDQETADVSEDYRGHFNAGGSFNTIVDARKFAAKRLGHPVEPGTAEAKQVDEAIEFGVVKAARDRVNRGGSGTDAKSVYRDLVDLYGRMPSLSTRTSTSIANQAYSTPAPLAYVAAKLANIGPGRSVYEPSAGNGALLMTADDNFTYANEIDPDRAARLKKAFPKAEVSQKNAAEWKPVSRFDAVIANPPFGVTKDADGNTVRFQVDQRYETAEIDHAIALKALESMKDDGSAVLLVGSVNKQARSEEARSDAYNSKAKREFYLTLYGRYNVVDHFTVAGEMYSRQGAGWPIDVIVIRGRGKSSKPVPAAEPPRVYDSWQALSEVLDAQYETARPDRGTDAGTDRDVGRPAGRDERDRPAVRGGEPDTGRGRAGEGPRVGEPVRGGRADEQSRDGGLSESRPKGTRASEPDRQPRPDARPDTGAQRVAEEDLGAIFDQELDAAFPEEKTRTPEPAPLTARAAAAETVKETAKGLDDIARGLSELFGGGKTIGAGPAFDPETYARAKPLFIEGAKHFHKAGQSARETVRLLIAALRDKYRFTREMLANMKPYIVRFVGELQSGEATLATEAPARPRGKVAEDSESGKQVSYRPASGGDPMGTLVPVNMQTSIADALQTLRGKVGDIDAYVADNLGYRPDELGKYFGAEQVDAIALALDNMERGAGFIIGDQTGIGKGRVVAAIIRFALKEGRTPIFVTEKPNLYADMYRDLTDIGIVDFLGREPEIMPTNNSLKVDLDEEGNKTLRTGTSAAHGAKIREQMNEGKLDADMIFTTYSQMQTVREDVTDRMRFLETFARGGIVIMDESHNAGGTVQTGPGGEKVKNDKMKVTRATFARSLTRLAHGVFYSSATYAKRPDVMDLYATTDMKMAVADISELGPAILKGGVPMQQVVAAMLAKAGQYIRRERSFDGIEYRAPVVTVNRQVYTDYTQILKTIQTFSDRYVKGATKGFDKAMKAAGKKVSADGSTGGAGANSTNFTAIMHNLIDQMLLAIKADVAAQMAIEARANGQKPVITVANTMGSFLAEQADLLGIHNGDVIDLSFQDLMLRYLERSRIILIKQPFSKDAGERHRLTDEELGPAGVAAYDAAKKQIENSDLSDLPVSPIDHLHRLMKDKGLRSGEITGRTSAIDYRRDGRAYYRIRPARETSIAARRKAITGFNRGDLDVLIINQAGSTGISLHASEKFKDQSPRRMIIAQAEKNIDTHMQMLGRIHRTGQVVLPSFDQLVADVPAEKRPAAILAKKMASLNANTTASRESALKADEVPDFLNEYGDEIAARLMEDNPDIHDFLGNPLKDSTSGDGLEKTDAMRKVTGRIPLLPVQQQEDVYELLETEYNDLLAQKEAAGESVLEAKTLELDAVVQEREQVVAPAGGNSPFADGVYVEKASVKRLGKPYSTDRVKEMVAETIGESDPAKWKQAGRKWVHDLIASPLEEFRAYRQSLVDDLESDAARRNTDARMDNIHERFYRLAATLVPGNSVKLMTSRGNYYGIVTKIEKTGKAKNPLALGSWKATIATADASRQMKLPFSQMWGGGMSSPSDSGTAIDVEPAAKIGDVPVIEAFDRMQQESREDRVILTGNILTAFDHVRGRGSIINFTDHDGNVRQGILMPRDYNYAADQSERPVPLRSVEQVLAFVDRTNAIRSKDKDVEIARHGAGYRIEISKSKARGGKYYLDRRVLDALGKDFVSVGNVMRADVERIEAPAVVEALKNVGAGFQAVDNLDIAKEIAGKVAGEDVGNFGRHMGFATRPDQIVRTRENTAEGYQIDFVATPEFEGQRTAIAAEIRAMLDKMGLREIGVRVHDQIVVKAGGETFEAMGRQIGSVIDLALSDRAEVRRFARHEAFHALGPSGLGLLNKAEWDVLSRASEKMWIPQYDIERGYHFASRAQQIEEGMAYAYSDWKGGKFKTGGLINRAFNKIRRFLDAIRNVLRGNGFRTADSVFSKVESGEVGARERKGSGQTAEDKFAAAWHGGPHDFDRFSTEKIGTGEGAQVYGWGLYFASRKGVAEFYREQLSGRRKIPPDVLDALHSLDFLGFDTAGQALSNIRAHADWQQRWDADPKNHPQFSNDIEVIQKYIENTNLKGRLYQVNLAPAEDEYLYWDKPLSEQSEKVKAALERMAENEPSYRQVIRNEMKEVGRDAWMGEKFYKWLADRIVGTVPDADWTQVGGRQKGAARAASLALNEAGIPGIKYLDQGSRQPKMADDIRIWKTGSQTNGEDIYDVRGYLRSGGKAFEENLTAKAVREFLGDDLGGSMLAELENKGPHEKATRDLAKPRLFGPEPSYNYVIFDESHVEIEQKFARRPAEVERERTAQAEDARNFRDRLWDTLSSPASWYGALGALPEQRRYLGERYRALGKIGKIEDVARQIDKTFSGAAEPVQRQVYDYLTTRDADPALIEDAEIRGEAVRTKRMIENIGERLVDAGLLSEEARASHEGEYLPRIYLKHLLDKDSFAAIGGRPKASDMGYLKARKDIPEDVRMLILGQITDPGFLASTGYAKPARDLAILEFLEQVSRNEEWVFPKTLVEYGGRRVTAHYLKSEADRIRKALPHYAPELREAAKAKAEEMEQAALPVLDEAPAEPQRFKQVPDNRRYGSLRGMYVRSEIYDDVVGSSSWQPSDKDDAASWVWGKLARLNSLWKLSKVALNPPSQIRNFVSNGSLLHISGVRFDQVPVRVVQALREIRSNGQYWKVAKEYGVTQTTFAQQELARIERRLLRLQGMHNSPMAWIKEAGAVIANTAGDVYGMSEALFKTAKIIDEMKKGKSAEEAAIEAHKWLFDYSLVPSSIRSLRQAPVGAPFITWVYKSTPRILEVAVKRPTAFLPYYLIPAIFSALISMEYDVDYDDLDKLRKALPKWLREKGNAFLLPFKDAEGRWQYVDFGYFLPWGAQWEIAKKTGDGDLIGALEAVGFGGAPMTQLTSAVQTNIDPFTKREIANKSDPPARQLAAWMAYLWRMAAPTWLTDFGAVNKTLDAMGVSVTAPGIPFEIGGSSTTRRGEPGPTVPQALARFVGVNAYPIDPEASRASNLRGMRYEIRQVDRRMGEIRKDNRLTIDQRRDRILDLQRKKKDLIVQFQKYGKDSEVHPNLRR